LAEGAPIQTVQGLAGHSTAKMTERYCRYLHEHQRILVKREDAKTVSAGLLMR
jgi:site-specific recombinase XerD